MIDLGIKQRGFTLVELLISMSIIAILAVVLSVSFSNAQKGGRDQRRIEDMKAVQSAAEQYYLLKGSYPTTVSSWSVNSQVVLQSFPVDPKGTSYYADSSNTSSAYCFCALLENSKNANAGWASPHCDWSNKTSYFCVKNQQ